MRATQVAHASQKTRDTQKRQAATCQIAYCNLEATVHLVVSKTELVLVCETCHAAGAGRWLQQGKRVARYLNQAEEPICVPVDGESQSRHRAVAGAVSGFVAPAFSPYWIPCIRCQRAVLFRWPHKTSVLCSQCWNDTPYQRANQSHDETQDSGVSQMSEAPNTQARANVTATTISNARAVPAETTKGTARATEQSDDHTMHASPKDEVASFEWGGRPWGDSKPFWLRIAPRLRAPAREAYEERAAIMEYHGNLIRAEAEHRAYQCVLERAQQAGVVKT